MRVHTAHDALPTLEGHHAMRARLRLVLALWISVCVALTIVGCERQAPAPLELGAGDNGTTESLVAGQELKIALESNPTTGYRWAIDGELPAQLLQEAQPVYTAGSTAIGSGGTEVWSFKAQGSGEGTLKLKYARSFEPTAPPANTFTLKLSVK
jgi:inhibitor of cysteine peptidase